MSWLRHRQPLLLTALLDGLALALGLFFISEARHGMQLSSIQQFFGLIVSYWILGWLFGSYSLLRWPKLKWPLMLQRVGLSALATLMLSLLVGWFVKTTPQEMPLLQRGSLGPLMLITGVASIAIRIFLHHLQTKRSTGWSALVDATEKDQIKKEWHRCSNRLMPQLFELDSLKSSFDAPGAMLAVSPIIQQSVDLQPLLQEALSRGIRLTSLAQLAEEELQRIPAQWLDESVLQLGELAVGRQLGFSRQLKRFADLVISAVLLIIAIPILIPIAIAIYLQDRGPVFYSQIRTGLFSEPFKIYKLRTMHQKAETNGPGWSNLNDQRITPMGKWLRQTRLDELPQLLNIIKG
ncbi:MAG: sugar transferase, partial [Synechococcaceae bacterium WB5_2A_257]|nr:sugar transferase [Synechococcaceae bacterium WB5_2A_257]